MKVELERAVAIQGMHENWILAIMPKYENSAPGPRKWIFSEIFMKRSLNFASNEPSTNPDIKFKSSYARKLDFSLLCPNMEIQPQAPKNGIFQKKILFFDKVSRFRPQPPLDIKFKSSYARKRDFGYYAQIWKFGPRLPKMEFFKKISFFWKGLQISLLTSSQPLAVMQENILSKKLSLGLNFSTPSGGVTSPSLKGSMVWA